MIALVVWFAASVLAGLVIGPVLTRCGECQMR
jgi:hypothetical protein